MLDLESLIKFTRFALKIKPRKDSVDIPGSIEDLIFRNIDQDSNNWASIPSETFFDSLENIKKQIIKNKDKIYPAIEKLFKALYKKEAQNSDKDWMKLFVSRINNLNCNLVNAEKPKQEKLKESGTSKGNKNPTSTAKPETSTEPKKAEKATKPKKPKKESIMSKLTSVFTATKSRQVDPNIQVDPKTINLNKVQNEQKKKTTEWYIPFVDIGNNAPNTSSTTQNKNTTQNINTRINKIQGLTEISIS